MTTESDNRARLAALDESLADHDRWRLDQTRRSIEKALSEGIPDNIVGGRLLGHAIVNYIAACEMVGVKP